VLLSVLIPLAGRHTAPTKLQHVDDQRQSSPISTRQLRGVVDKYMIRW